MSEKETRFTPGTWTATHSDPAEGCDVFWITSPNAIGPHNGEVEICSVPGNKPANASLIAAAPDLYEAAKLARDGYSNLIEMWEIKGDDPVLYVYAKLVSALSKALGENKPCI